MASNLRAAPIEGFVCDAAGNTIRNASIVIRDNAPNGSSIIATTSSDDNGYFITDPVQNGTYDVFESGVKVSRILHNPHMATIQPYAASPSNLPSDLPSFIELQGDTEDINTFRHYIQIENDNLNLQFGHSFPIYDVDLTQTSFGWSNFVNFHGLTNSSRITTTRFDVEYYNQIIAKRVRWVGVPGIQFTENSKLVLPLDFYSIRINRTNYMATFGPNINYHYNSSNKTIKLCDTASSDPQFSYLQSNIVVGDILKLTIGLYIFYGIVLAPTQLEIGTTYYNAIELILWKSSNYSSYDFGEHDSDGLIDSVTKADGFFNGITNTGSSIGEKFCVTENQYAQDIDAELYNY